MIEKTIKIDDTIYYIYNDCGEYKMTTKTNFNKYIQNAREISTFNGFTSANQVAEYLTKYCKNVEVL